jgi:hypothetical protein
VSPPRAHRCVTSTSVSPAIHSCTATAIAAHLYLLTQRRSGGGSTMLCSIDHGTSALNSSASAGPGETRAPHSHLAHGGGAAVATPVTCGSARERGPVVRCPDRPSDPRTRRHLSRELGITPVAAAARMLPETDRARSITTAAASSTSSSAPIAVAFVFRSSPVRRGGTDPLPLTQVISAANATAASEFQRIKRTCPLSCTPRRCSVAAPPPPAPAACGAGHGTARAAIPQCPGNAVSAESPPNLCARV